MKHDYHHAVTGAYLFSKNSLDIETCKALEKDLTPVRVYRNNTPSFPVRRDRRFLRYQTAYNGSADGKGYYKYA